MNIMNYEEFREDIMDRGCMFSSLKLISHLRGEKQLKFVSIDKGENRPTSLKISKGKAGKKVRINRFLIKDYINEPWDANGVAVIPTLFYIAFIIPPYST